MYNNYFYVDIFEAISLYTFSFNCISTWDFLTIYVSHANIFIVRSFHRNFKGNTIEFWKILLSILNGFFIKKKI